MTATSHGQYCEHHHAVIARVERTEDDVQRLYDKQDHILWATLSSAGASILCLVGIIASSIIGR
jgi:hypothetical protein